MYLFKLCSLDYNIIWELETAAASASDPKWLFRRSCQSPQWDALMTNHISNFTLDTEKLAQQPIITKNERQTNPQNLDERK